MNFEHAQSLLKIAFEGYDGDKVDLIRALNEMLVKSQQTCEDVVHVADNDSEQLFDKDGGRSVEELISILRKGKYEIKPHTEKGKQNAYYKVSNGVKYIFVENHDTYPRNDFGMITTDNISYSEETSSIIKRWDYFGKTKKRKQYYFKGKSIKETLIIIDTILS